MNKWIGMGRPTKEPEVRYTTGAKPMCVARFNFAVDRKFKKEGEQTADFINCIAFGKTGEFVEKYVSKGRRYVVEGHIQTGSYTNKDGQKIYTTDIVVDGIEFADSKSDSQGSGNGGEKQSAPVKKDDFVNVPASADDEGLPFN